MTSMPRKPGLCIHLVLLSCCWLAGCAGYGELFQSEGSKPAFINKSMSVQDAHDAILIEKSTKADVLAVLGNAAVVRFDSGYEVWVYRGKPSRAPATGAEFVILFTPAGRVKKTRIRPAYDGRTE